MSQNSVSEFLMQCIRYNNSNLSRIENCIARLDHSSVWKQPNGSTNSIGNLVLHLCGNIRQYIISGIGGQADQRDRDAEFVPGQNLSIEELLMRIRTTITGAAEVIQNASDEDLDRIYGIQGVSISGTEAILHVTEHLSYHVGQIALLTKLFKDEDLGFYAGRNLNAKNG